MNKKQMKTKMVGLIEFAKRKNNVKRLYPTLVTYDKNGNLSVHELFGKDACSVAVELTKDEKLVCGILVMGAYLTEIDPKTGHEEKYDAISLFGKLRTTGEVLNVRLRDYMDSTYGKAIWDEAKSEDVRGTMGDFMGGNALLKAKCEMCKKPMSYAELRDTADGKKWGGYDCVVTYNEVEHKGGDA